MTLQPWQGLFDYSTLLVRLVSLAVLLVLVRSFFLLPRRATRRPGPCPPGGATTVL